MARDPEVLKQINELLSAVEERIDAVKSHAISCGCSYLELRTNNGDWVVDSLFVAKSNALLAKALLT